MSLQLFREQCLRYRRDFLAHGETTHTDRTLRRLTRSFLGLNENDQSTYLSELTKDIEALSCVNIADQGIKAGAVIGVAAAVTDATLGGGFGFLRTPVVAGTGFLLSSAGITLFKSYEKGMGDEVAKQLTQAKPNATLSSALQLARLVKSNENISEALTYVLGIKPLDKNNHSIPETETGLRRRR